MSASSPPPGILRVGMLSTVQSLDPLHAQDFGNGMVVAQIFEAPYAPPTREREARPQLFRGPLEADTESKNFSAAVRDDVVFSDGTPLTAALMAESLRRSTTLAEQCEVTVDGDRLVFRLARPNARFDLVLTQAYAAVTLERDGKLLGTGPFLPADDATPERMRLVRNERYRRPVAIDEVIFRCYPPDQDGRPGELLAAIERGEVDFTNMLPRDDVSTLSQVRKYFEPGSSTALLYMNCERPALADRRARQAVALAIDRLELATLSHKHALAHTAANILPPLMSEWRDDLRPNPERARALLEEQGDGVPRHLQMKMIFGPRPYLPHPQRSATYIAAQLGEIGFHTDVEQTRDGEDYFRTLASGDFDLFLSGWIADTTDPVDFLEAILSPSMIPEPGRAISVEANLARWRSERADELIQKLRREPNEADQRQLLRLAAAEMPALPLMHGAMSFVHGWRVRNFEPPPLGIPDFSQLELRDLFGGGAGARPEAG